MLPVSSLLNPIKSESRSPHRYSRSSCGSPFWSTSSAYNSTISASHSYIAKQKMSKDGAVFSKGKIKGEVKFPPFESLDPNTLHEVQKYKVYPLGQIQSYCRHIPYNSEKKSFLERTGRESFEVFQYEFRLPGEEKVYTVMWDYNVGLVRITPFFKCCKYSKTTPAKMLNLNPGLKEITHSITGGALAAQGYWMPYSCALAICATFCDHISGALIPIFGPTFPSQCIPTNATNYARMTIDPVIIMTATEQAEYFRNYYSSTVARSAFPSPSSSSGSSCERFRDIDSRGFVTTHGTPPSLTPRRLKRSFTNDIYRSDTDASDMSTSSGDRFIYSPVTPSSPATPVKDREWNATNTTSQMNTPRSIPFDEAAFAHRATMSGVASPWLSAIPRSRAIVPRSNQPGMWQSKRSIDDVDDGYDAGESEGESTKLSRVESGLESTSPKDDIIRAEVTNKEDFSSAEGIKKAALGLMNLCVYDPERTSPRGSPYTTFRSGTNVQRVLDNPEDDDGPRRKRMRATSV